MGNKVQAERQRERLSELAQKWDAIVRSTDMNKTVESGRNDQARKNARNKYGVKLRILSSATTSYLRHRRSMQLAEATVTTQLTSESLTSV